MSAVNPYQPPSAAVADIAPEDGVQPVRVWSARGRIGRLRYMAYGTSAYLLLARKNVHHCRLNEVEEFVLGLLAARADDARNGQRTGALHVDGGGAQDRHRRRDDVVAEHVGNGRRVDAVVKDEAAAVAGSDINDLHPFGLCELPCQRMFTATGADYQDFHSPDVIQVAERLVRAEAGSVAGQVGADFLGKDRKMAVHQPS